ncbi:uncharacterized protein [Parasteatoda tepidariorum]|uniref:uncharacterized protein isoform X2 n=1 Tax=Parasteatoda tepidariorum TaxID=114398 RepID=UPI001C7292AC|nr:uncharacterized protein LOC107448563 isoform X2 [Parasteatoda tepidariorum]
MGNFFKTRSVFLFALSLLAVLALIECETDPEFTDTLPSFICPKSGTNDPLPSFPPTFSADTRLNFPNKQLTVELRHYKDEAGKRESLEIFAPGRHVKYVVHDKQHLLINFPDNDYATCSVTSSSTIQLEDEDSGPNGFLQKVLDVTKKPNEFFLADSGVNNGVFSKKWEGCFVNPKINVSIRFSEVDWKNPGNDTKNKRLPVSMEAQIDGDFVTGLIDNLQASMPDDIYFQPPADVYCPGFREDVKPPEFPDFFSYDGELMMFETRTEVIPFVSHRSVYYDYPAGISRVDYHDPLSEIEDSAEDKVVAKGISVIHDFNSRIQYSFMLPTWQCEVEEFETTAEIVEEKETKETAMITAKQYFALDVKKISYNGQFMHRGYLADVFTATVQHFDGSDGKNIYSWFFSSVQTKIVQNEKLEKNVLLRMLVRPESGSKRRDRIELNIYNFETQEPTADVFDITNCYDENLSKAYVITFPANNALRGSEKILKLAAHLALKEATGLSKQRIFVSETVFNKQFLFVEFKLLEAPTSLKPNVTKKEMSLADAAAKLKKSVQDGSFKLSVSADSGLITLIPQKDGFNEFSGDRKVQDTSSFSQGSVVGLTIGMLLLGFVLGGVALNLIVSRKFGVSLFKR